MSDPLQDQAEALMIQLETRLGIAATYTQRGPQTVAADGTMSRTETATLCTLIPDIMTARDVAIIGSGLEEQVQMWKGRASVLGSSLSRGDTVTVGGVVQEVVSPVDLDPLQVTWRFAARKVA